MAKKKADNEIPPPPPSKCRRFWLYRKEDPSGVSGTGYVAEGVEWTDGRVDVRFLSSHKTDNGFPNLKEMHNLHGHEGDTEVVWVDPPLGKTEES
jgi:hypothetical protein